jgi:hypothetical protein
MKYLYCLFFYNHLVAIHYFYPIQTWQAQDYKQDLLSHPAIGK